MDFEEALSDLISSKKMASYINVKRDENGKIVALRLSRLGLNNTNPVMAKFIDHIYNLSLGD